MDTAAARQRWTVRQERVSGADACRLAAQFEQAAGTARAAELADVVAWALEIAPPGPVLDVGSGLGTFVGVMRERDRDRDPERGRSVFGLEPDADDVRDAGAARNGWFIRGVGEALPFANHTFAAVTGWNLLEHVENWRAVLQEMDRVLRPGGVLCLEAPNYGTFRREPHYHLPWPPLLPRSVASRYIRALGRDPEFFERHIHYVTLPSVLSWLGRANFRVDVPEVRKLERLESILNPRTRRLIRVAQKVGVVSLVQRAVRVRGLNPLQPVIFLVAWKSN